MPDTDPPGQPLPCEPDDDATYRRVSAADLPDGDEIDSGTVVDPGAPA